MSLRRHRHHPRHPRSRRGAAPGFERLEGRDLLSSTALLASSGSLNQSHPSAASETTTSSTAWSPTPHELARQRFSARFKGPYVIGRPRFLEQASQTYLYGGGISSAFLHGDLQLTFAVPRDPSQPIVGQANLMEKSLSATGNQLILDLVGDPTSLDRAGRPTRFTWTQNPASGGTFTNGSGSGTVQLRFMPGDRRPRRAFSAGTVGVIFTGLLYTTNLTNALRNQ